MAAALVAAVLVTACGAASAPTAAGVRLDRETTARLQKVLDEEFPDSGLAGVGVAVWIGSQRWTATLGFADLASRTPFRLGDNFRIASITKTFTATAVLQLVAQGRLRLDDRLETYVPGIPNGDQVTIRQLLGMQSGLYEFSSDVGFLAAFTADPTMPFGPEDAVGIVKRNPPQFAPGARVEYTDSNYVLLGLVIEAVTGRPAGEVITTGILKPLGLASTLYPTGNSVPPPHPTGYVPNPDDPAAAPTIVDDLNPAIPAAGGAMISTVEDLRRWARELTDGTLLNPQLQAERLVSRRFEKQRVNAGYGLGVERINDIVGHTGAIFGYSTAVFRIARYDATVVVAGNGSTNSTTPSGKIALLVLRALYPRQVT